MKIASFLPQDCTENPEDLTSEGSRHEACRAESYFKKKNQTTKLGVIAGYSQDFMHLVSAWMHLVLFFPADLVSVLGDLLFSEQSSLAAEELLFVNTNIVKT